MKNREAIDRTLVCLLAFCAVATSLAAPLIGFSNEFAIPGRYIVVFKKNAVVDVYDYVSQLNKKFVAHGSRNSILHTYEINHFKGFAAVLDANSLKNELENPLVDFVEADQWMFTAHGMDLQETSTITQSGATWGIDRISKRKLPLTGTYTYPASAGKGVNAYVLDTGVYIDHNEFEGRASWGWAPPGENATDCNGHGTHVAGTIGGKLYGVAKNVNIIAVKVLYCNGQGTTANVIAGVNYVASDNKNSGKRSVANMSLSGKSTTAVNQAIAAAVESGVVFVVAAGNDNANACKYSPANEPSVISVAASKQNDERSGFSNWGTCVDIFAPGSSITSAWNNSPSATNTISGTSMASPHITGIAALHLAENPSADPIATKKFILQNGSAGVITKPKDSPDILGYSLADVQ